MNTMDEVLERARGLDVNSRLQLMDLADGLQGLPSVEKAVFVEEYAAHLDSRRASEAAGWQPGYGATLLRNDDSVKQAVLERLQRRFTDVKLTGDYIRNYLATILEFCPTDYHFSPSGAKNKWCIDPEEFNKVPDEVRRLVEYVELREVCGETVLIVKFISKTAALAIAAKYVLTQKIDLKASINVFDEIAGHVPRDEYQHIEARIKQVVNERAGAEGSAEVH